VSVIFDINKSNMILMEQQPKKEIKVLGKKVLVEDSEDEDPGFL